MKNAFLMFSIPAVLCGCPTFGPVQRDIGCPSRDFGEFAIAFTNSVDIQRRWIKDSVVFTYRDSVKDGVDTHVKDKRDIKFPVIETFKELTTFGLSFQVGLNTENSGSIYRIGTDSGWHVIYTFEKTELGCWMLSNVDEYNF